MAPTSSRPLTTYARRRTRSTQSGQHVSQSSPIRPLSPSTDDVSFALMAQRMNKRARRPAQSTRGTDVNSARTAAGEDEDRPAKRTRAPHVDLHQLTPGDHVMTDDYMLYDFTQSGPPLHTPIQSVPSECSMIPSSALRPPASDQLSPLPIAKRILSRTSSRNFKENAGQRGSRSLASPFTSRPGSRASSPKRKTRKRLGRHAKSRTLSQSGALAEKPVDRNLPSGQVIPGQLSSNIAGADGRGDQTKPTTSAHGRASSIPTLKPALDHIAPEAWLVPPKALSRPPPAHDSEQEGGGQHDMALDVEHASFYLDAPVQISTPPRRRRSATVGVWAHGLMPPIDADPPPPVRSFRYDSDVDMTDGSCPGSPSDTRSRLGNPLRRRRRTIVHLPSDSLFSSSLDFSALMSETERFPRPPSSEGSRSPQPRLSARSDLAPAFSLHNSPVEQTARRSPDHSLALTGPGSSGQISGLGSLGAADGDDSSRGPLPSSHDSGFIPARTPPDVDGDELLDLFSVLGLDEDEKWGVLDADDSGIAFLPSKAPKLQPPEGGRARRKRGDTIRASDFSKMPASASFDSASRAGPSGAQRPPPRRTRSGTVTQATSSSISGSGRRKHDGWPTIKMRTTDEPLRVDGDEADDELLLKDGDIVD